MRLGDLDALKEKVALMWGDNSHITESVNEIIDNTPTVKFSLMPADETKEDAYKRGYKRGKIAGILEANTRPQGEWIKLRDYDFKCSLCGYSLMDKYNFCPFCGAEMEIEQ